MKINLLQVLFSFSMEIKPQGGDLAWGKKKNQLDSNTVLHRKLHATLIPLLSAIKSHQKELN